MADRRKYESPYQRRRKARRKYESPYQRRRKARQRRDALIVLATIVAMPVAAFFAYAVGSGMANY